MSLLSIIFAAIVANVGVKRKLEHPRISVRFDIDF
jgi:hypothetical protein